MITSIKKRGGREVHFFPGEITRAISLAASRVAQEGDSKADYETAGILTRKVVNLLNNAYQSTTSIVKNVQDAVIKVLIETGCARISEAYILYRAERTRIRNMKTRLMKSIEETVFANSNDVGIGCENINIDGNTAVGIMLQYGGAVSKGLCMSQLTNSQHAALHENGDIHIHDMDFMNMGALTCCQVGSEKLSNDGFSTGHGHLCEPQDITNYATLVAITIQSNQDDQHGGQGILAFDFYLTKGVAKTFRREYISNLNKALELFINLDAGVKEPFGAVKKETGKIAATVMDNSFLNSLSAMLKEIFGFSEEQIELINKFAYKEVDVATRRRTYQVVEAFVHNLNTMHSRAGVQVPFSSINFGTDMTSEDRLISESLILAQEAGLRNGETPIFPVLVFKAREDINYNSEDPNYNLFKLAMYVFAKHLFPSLSFMDAPFNKQYYKEGHPETETIYMGCCTRAMGNINSPEIATGRGNNSFTSANLPRLGIKHGIAVNGDFNGATLFNELGEKMEIIIQQLLERLGIQGRKKVRNFPFLMGQGVWIGGGNLSWGDTSEEIIRQGTLTTGFIGLAKCLKVPVGEHCGKSEEVQKFGLRIVGHMRGVCDEVIEKYGLNFSLAATSAKDLPERFTWIDGKIYGIIPGVIDRDYYTNSFHVPVHYHIAAFKEIQKGVPYHKFINGGHISYVEVDGDPTNNLEVFGSIVRCIRDAGIGYDSINHLVDCDSCCGYSDVIEGHVYPRCGRDEYEEEYKFEKVRRTTGYLVGTADRFNSAETSEGRDRVKHG